MEFFAIIIGFIILQFWGSVGAVQQDDWFSQLCGKALTLFESSEMRVAFVMIVPALGVSVLISLLDWVFFGLVAFVLVVATFLYSLGRGDLGESLYSYLASWDEGNFESARQKARQIGDFSDDNSVTDPQSLHASVRGAYLYASFERWFAVVFWFMVLGPIGAIGYRSLFLSARSDVLDTDDRAVAATLVSYLDWIPLRLQIFSFAVAGNFVDGIQEILRKLWGNTSESQLLDDCALAAIGSDEIEPYSGDDDQQSYMAAGREQLLALQSLISRSAVCWLVVIAVISIL